ncbi:cadherin repeat domain-containing protein, partial [Pseudomonadales bacterium]|nr:cadherin repeat domain-containing protein [Pseudomonadales bacterium]
MSRKKKIIPNLCLSVCLFLLSTALSIVAFPESEVDQHSNTPSFAVSGQTIDIDGNEQIDALTDGLLILRGMFGLSGNSLIAGVVGSDAVYVEAEDIESRIASLESRLDIDDNGETNPLTDGLIVLRYLFGLEGDALVKGALADDAARARSEEIESYLDTLKSPVVGRLEFSSPAAFSVEENQKAIGKVTAINVDSNDIWITFTVSSSKLLITADGLLTFSAAPDYEAKSSYQATVIASDGTNSAAQDITVTVTDVNEAPVFSSASSFGVAENQTAVGTVIATDPEGDTLTFSTSDPDLSITSAGVLTFKVAPDYETNSFYGAAVTATDGINSTTQHITVTVTDINDAAPVFTSNSIFVAAENQTAIYLDGSLYTDIGVVTASDDEADNGLIVFTTSSSELNITPAGILSFKIAPDYEEKSVYTATVTATDGSNTTTQDITVYVVNFDDEAPQFSSSAIQNIPECCQVWDGFSITASDPDFTPAGGPSDSKGSLINFEILGDNELFTVISNFGGSVNGRVIFTDWTDVDFEEQQIYLLTVSACDLNNNCSNQDITINITDVDDEPPKFTSPLTWFVPENQRSVGTLTATDVDSDDSTLTFENRRNPGYFNLTSDGILTFPDDSDAPDYEHFGHIHKEALTVCDEAGNCTREVVTVNVTDVDDVAPFFTFNSSFNAAENQTAIGTVTASDVDTDNDLIAYSVSGSDFLMTSDGVFTFVTAPDYETKTSYSAAITATDGTNSSTMDVAVYVRNVDDVAPKFISSSNFDVREGNELGMNFGSVVVSDIDTDDISLIQFSVSGSDFSINTESNLLNRAYGYLALLSPVDYETKSSYTATVTASDGINASSQDITVYIEDADDEAPIITSPLNFTIPENQSFIGTLTAEDIDSSSVIWSIDEDFVQFDSYPISMSAEISFGFEPDFELESNRNYTITVTARSGTNSTTENITVNVTDVNDVAPIFTSNSSFSAAESQTAIGTVSATDVDTDNGLITFEVSGSELLITPGGVLTFATAPDYETKTFYSARVTATDGTNSTTQDISVLVTDANDSAPVFTYNSSFSAAENQTSIGTITASDPEGDDVSFAISGSELLITSGGVLTFASAPDYEMKSSYSATVTATDGINSTTQSINVNVTDIDDVAPVFTSNPNFSAAENQATIGIVTATDVDTDNGLITFEVSGSELLITTGGSLTFASAPEYEMKSSYSATVTATDGTNSTTQNITVAVVDADELSPQVVGPMHPVQTSNFGFHVPENRESIGTLLAVDTDSASWSFYLTNPFDDQCDKNFQLSSTGALSFKSPPDYEDGSWSCFPMVIVEDQMGNKSDRTQIFVSVFDVDDTAPVFTSNSSFSAAENKMAIGIVTATDVDTDDGSITFVVSGSELLITSGGALTFASAPDYEAKSSYSAMVTATDGTNSTTQNITVAVTKADDSAPLFTSESSFRADENQTTIGTITASDPEGDDVSFAISGSELVITSGGVLTFASVPDYETTSSYSATVTATDGTNSTTQSITVNVSDIDDTAPTFTTDSSFIAAENQTAIGTVKATDVDTDDDLIILSVSGSELTVAPTGALAFISAPDYEIKSSYSALVTASDRVRTTTQNIVITVSDIDDTAPVFTSNSSFSATENQTAIGAVTATDVDTDNGLITFEVSGSELLITSGGVLTFASAPDYEARSSYSAIVTASDGERTTTQNITVAIT